MASHGLCRRCPDCSVVGLDVGYSSSWDVSATTTGKGRYVERETLGCEFEYIGDWLGDREYDNSHQYVQEPCWTTSPR